MAVTARFFVDRIVKHSRFDGIEVFMAPVTGGRANSPDNSSWAKFTPSGEIRLNVNNPSASSWFESMLGKDIAITFEERPESETPSA